MTLYHVHESEGGDDTGYLINAHTPKEAVKFWLENLELKPDDVEGNVTVFAYEAPSDHIGVVAWGASNHLRYVGSQHASLWVGDICRTCGDTYDPYGDGYDGECPSCADKSFEKEGWESEDGIDQN